MADSIISRIEAELELPGLFEKLQELSGSDFHSLLLMLMKNRVESIIPSTLLQISPVTQSCSLDARLLNRMDAVAYELAADFEAISLSPVLPLGAVSVLSGLDQGNVLSTIRAFELASDPTVGLGLELADRRKSPQNRAELMRACTSQRVLRFPLPKTKGYTSHFNLFALVTAGRDSGSFSFELCALLEQVDFYCRFLLALSSCGIEVQNIQVELCDTRVVSHLCEKFAVSRELIKREVRASDSKSSARVLEMCSADWPADLHQPLDELASFAVPAHLKIQMDLLEQRVAQELRRRFPGISVRFNLHRLTGLSYYEGPCFHLKAANRAGDTFMIADGGFVAWTRRLLADKKERLLTSAIGVELLARIFRN